MNKEQENAIDNLRSDNFELSNLVKSAVNVSVKKSIDMLENIDDPNELLTIVKTIETATKIVGLSPKESQTNVQINAINGFDFVEIDKEEVIQLSVIEEFEEGEIDEED